jgi:hypothetical protein
MLPNGANMDMVYSTDGTGGGHIYVGTNIAGLTNQPVAMVLRVMAGRQWLSILRGGVVSRYATNSAGVHASQVGIALGGWYNGGGEWTDGEIADFDVWRRWLSDEEVDSLLAWARAEYDLT